MEWNARSPLPWEWENIMTSNITTSEITKKLGSTSTEWGMNADGGIDSDFFSSSGAGVNSGSTSEVGVVSASTSSKCASASSLSPGDPKQTRFTVEAFEGVPDRLNNKKERGNARSASPILKPSVGSSEPLLSLKLGKGTYFNDVCAGSKTKSSSHSLPAKKCKLNCSSTEAPHCQVEGCNLDLSSAKDYHRKHRVCEKHSKSPGVIVAGVECRFCQQCSRFHGLSEFDEKKRSCRRRLSDHNARRRKPQGETFRFSAARLHTASYDGKQQIGFIWNRTPFVNTVSNGNPFWQSKVGSKSTPIKSHYLEKLGNTNGQLNAAGNQLLNSISMHCPQSSGFMPLPAKCYTSEVLYQERSTISSNMDASQELHSALSLLSTDCWSSFEPNHGSFNLPVPTNNTTPSARPLMQASPLSSPITVLEPWRPDHQQMDQNLHAAVHGIRENHHQEFQLLRPPYYSS